MPETKKKKKIKEFLLTNKIFHTIVVLILLSIIIAPFLPEITFQARKLLGLRYVEEEIFLDTEEEEEERRQSKIEYISQRIEGNHLVIPTIGVSINVVEGNNDSVLFQGAWRRPNSSTPDKGGNVVITGHRYHYRPPNNRTFYNLDKLEIGSKIFLFWDGMEYVYETYEKFIVEPTRIDIENNTEEDILTLYTCHPLWTAERRLVVRASLVEVKDYKALSD